MTLLSRSHLLLLTLSLAGALLCWNAGHKGLFLLDQSMIFDSAWRILQGQMPYRDFGMPFGPVSSLLQAASFWLLGLHWDAMVFPATLLHALSVPLVWATQRRLFPEQPGLAAWSAALFAALSFYSPIGTLWFETTGIFFYLLALYLLTSNRPVADFAAGALLLVVFLSKQNVALFYGPCLLTWILLRPAPSGTRLPALLRFASGGLALLLTLLLAASTTGTLPAAWHYLIEIPRQIAAARTSAAGLPMGYPVLLNYVLAALFLALLPCLALQGLRHQWRPAVFHLIEIVAWALTALSTANELVIYSFGAGRLLSNTYALLSSATHREAARPLWLRALTPTYIL
ncbi:glycosyltransferase family 39 protein, partial [Nostoc sp. NIES-2111]